MPNPLPVEARDSAAKSSHLVKRLRLPVMNIECHLILETGALPIGLEFIIAIRPSVVDPIIVNPGADKFYTVAIAIREVSGDQRLGDGPVLRSNAPFIPFSVADLLAFTVIGNETNQEFSHVGI